MHKHRLISLLFILVGFISCTSKTNEKSSQEETTNVVVENDSSIIADEELIDWTPQGFKEEHFDEWQVVCPSIGIQQGDSMDFGKIDKLVRDYICKKTIALPKDPYLQIIRIEQICKDSFDISEYDYSNMGAHIADGTARLFEMYINWLMENAAQKRTKEIDYKKEHEMLNIVMDAFYPCCDSIGWAFEGSGGWHGHAEVHRIELKFMRNMYEMVLAKPKFTKMPFLLTPEHFRKECDARTINYKQLDEEFTSPQRVKEMLDDYYIATKKWLEYRSEVEKHLKNSELKLVYSYNTRIFAKELYVHLKNKFYDIGMVSESMYEQCYLHLDCSDEEMLNYSYEKAYTKYMKE